MRKLISSLLIEYYDYNKEAMLQTMETSIHFQELLMKGMEPLHSVNRKECMINDSAQYLEWIEKQVQEHAQNEDMRSLKHLFHQYQSEFASLMKVVSAKYASLSELLLVNFMDKYSAKFNILIENYVLYQKFLFKWKKMFNNNRKERTPCIFKLHLLIGKVTQNEFRTFMEEFYSQFEKEILAKWAIENLVLHFKDLLIMRSRLIELHFVGLLCFIWHHKRR